MILFREWSKQELTANNRRIQCSMAKKGGRSCEFQNAENENIDRILSPAIC
jgi:hypothetical protein